MIDHVYSTDPVNYVWLHPSKTTIEKLAVWGQFEESLNCTLVMVILYEPRKLFPAVFNPVIL